MKYWIIQLAGTIRPEWMDRIAAIQAYLMQPYPWYSYLCGATEEQAEKLQRLDFVSSIKRLAPEMKYDFSLFEELEQSNTVKKSQTCWVQLFDHSLSTKSLEKWGNRFGKVLQTSNQMDVLLDIPLANVSLLAKEEIVYRISPKIPFVGEGEVSCQIVAGNYDASNEAYNGSSVLSASLAYRKRYQSWLDKIEVDGTGIRVSVLEPDGYVDQSHPALANRIYYPKKDVQLKQNKDITYNQIVKINKLHSHGTCVAGIVMAKPDSSQPTNLELDSNNLYYGLGIAPGSTVVSQLANQEQEYEYCRIAVRNGALIQNASFGPDYPRGKGRYVFSEKMMDWAVRNSDNIKKDLTPLCIVVSAGNSGKEGKQKGGITEPGRAKNVITVGNFLNARPELASSTKLNKKNKASVFFNGINYRRGSSSMGDCGDGRIKPDVVAPGAYSIAPADENLNGIKSKKVINQNYYCFGGTSAAAPQVSGACALLMQWWKKKFNVYPSPAMLKAILINTAVDTHWLTQWDSQNKALDSSWTSPLRSGNIPNMEQGWGRICLNNFFFPPEAPESFCAFFDQDKQYLVKHDADNPKQFHFKVQVKSSNSPLKATLVWTDFSGVEGSGKKGVPCIVNTLGFRMETGTYTGNNSYFGNNFNGGWSQHGGGMDNYSENTCGVPINNVQNIFIENPTENTDYTFIVAPVGIYADCFQVSQFAKSKATGKWQQDFALMIYNTDPDAVTITTEDYDEQSYKPVTNQP
ncbi:MAG: S8 family serine peptidase [Bacteroidota bacterium]